MVIFPLFDGKPMKASLGVRLLLRKHILERLKEVAALPLQDRGQQRRHAKQLRGFGQPHNIVDDRLGVVTPQAGELEWLMVDQD